MTKQSELIVECTTKLQMDEVVQYATRGRDILSVDWRYVYYNIPAGIWTYGDIFEDLRHGVPYIIDHVPTISFKEWYSLPNTELISPWKII